jgi:THAP domain
MPRKCSIVGCRGNYDKRKSADNDDNNACSVFGFPKDADRLRKWLRIIPQENMTRNKISDYMGVCQRHFDPRYIVRHYTFHRSDGSVFSTPRDVPVLSYDAIPTIFPIKPSCSQTVSPPVVPPLKRQNLEDRCAEASVKTDELFRKRVADDSIPSYRLLKSNVRSRSIKLGMDRKLVKMF